MADNMRTVSTKSTSQNQGKQSGQTGKNPKPAQKEELLKEKKKKEKRERRRKRRKVRRIIISYLLVIFLLVGVIGGYYLYEKMGKKIMAYKEEAVELVADSSESTFRQDETSVVYDINGAKLRDVTGEKEVYYKTYDEIPAYFVEAMVSVEDRRFYEHNGVDYEGIARAAYILFKNDGNITQGASTITQQLARGIFLTNEVSYERKIKEIFIAWELEKKYTKQQILEFYLNNIFFSNGYYGIGAAAKGYFNKDLDELSISEVAFLCSIPNSPTYYDPRTNYDHTIDRRNKILKDMYGQGYINDVELDMALNENIVLADPEKVSHDYIETYTNFCATEALMAESGFKFQYKFDTIEEQQQYNKEYREAYDTYYATLYTGGFQIYTSFDPKKQRALQSTVDDVLSVDEEKNEETGIYNLQGAATCIDNSTGRVVAMVGGRTQNELQGYSLNRAYQSARQPGSTIKPLIVYTPQLERGYTPNTVVDDNAFEDSDGATTVEMASGYATIENDGEFRKPTCIVKITDAKGNVIVDDKIKSKQVYELNASRMMTSMLKGVFTGGTASGLGIPGMSCAGKTGTTDNNNDGWFCAYTPYYTTSVWVGYDTPQSTRGLWGSTYPGKIWHDYMTQIHEGLKDLGFPDYEYVRSTRDWKDTRSSSEESSEEVSSEVDQISEISTEVSTDIIIIPTEAPTEAPTEVPSTEAPTPPSTSEDE